MVRCLAGVKTLYLGGKPFLFAQFFDCRGYAQVTSQDVTQGVTLISSRFGRSIKPAFSHN